MNPNQAPEQHEDAPKTATPETVSTQKPASRGIAGLSKKKLIIISSIAAGVVVLLIIVALLYSALFAVSKADYRAAANATSEVSRTGSKSYSDIASLAYISTSTTEIENKNDIDTARETLAAYKESNATISDVKALRNGDVKKAYEAYNTRFVAYMAFSEDYLSSAEKVIPAIIKCEDIAKTSISDVSAYAGVVAPCEAALNAVKDVKDKDLNAFLEAYKKNVQDVTVIVNKVAAAGTDYAQRSALRTELSATSTALRDAQKDANSNITKRLSDVKPYDLLREFYDVTAEKSK